MGTFSNFAEIVVAKSSTACSLVITTCSGVRDQAQETSCVAISLVQASGAEPGKGLDDRQAQTVLNFGVALAMSGNDRGMGQLRKDFTAGMNASPFKDAFNLIVSPNSVGLVDYRSLAKKVATVSNFKDFMVVYKERLKAGKLSSLN